MAITGINKDEVKEFVSRFDTGEPKTVFEIGILTQQDKIELFKNVKSAKGDDVDLAKLQEHSAKMIIKGVKKIRNLYDRKEGKHKNYTEINYEVVNMLPQGVLGEVAQEVMKQNFVGEETEKN